MDQEGTLDQDPTQRHRHNSRVDGRTRISKLVLQDYTAPESDPAKESEIPKQEDEYEASTIELPDNRPRPKRLENEIPEDERKVTMENFESGKVDQS